MDLMNEERRRVKTPAASLIGMVDASIHLA